VEFTPGCNQADPPTGNWAPQWYLGKYRESAANVVVVRPGRITSRISATMRRGGQVAGTVTGPSGRGVAGVCVVVTTRRGVFAEQDTTPASGRYRIEALDPGRYRIGFFPGCGRSTRYLPQWWPGTAREYRSGLIRLGLGKLRAHVNARLLVGGKITGTIRFRNRHGRPIRGICVFVTPADQPFGTEFDGATGRNGGYQVAGLPPGRYDLSFGPGCGNDGNYLFWNDPHTVAVRTAQVRHVDAFLQPGAIVTGTVTDAAAGRPLAGICVFTTDTGDGAKTSKDGTYSISQIQPGPATIAFSNCSASGNFAPQYYPGQANEAAARAVVLRGGRVTAGIDAAMLPGATISGKLTWRTGRNVIGACAAAIPLNDVLAFEQFAVGFGTTGRSSRGGYAIKNLAAGQYQVAFENCGFQPNVADQWFRQRPGHATGDRIDLPEAGLVTGIDAVLRRGGTITGRIRGPAGHPRTFVCVTATDRRSGTVAFEQPIVPTGDGYGMEGVPAGSYTAEFTDCGGQSLATQWYRRASSPGNATPVVVTAGGTSGAISADMAVGGSISGLVVSKATGKPLAGVCVSAAAAGQPFAGASVSGRSGRYLVTGLATGSYRLSFSGCGSAELLGQRAPGRVRVIEGRTAAGPSAAMTGYDGGAISGRVLRSSPTLAAQPGVCVAVIPVGSGVAEGFATSSIRGYYKIGRLVPGKYKVFFGDPACASDPGGLAPQWYLAAASRSTATVVTVAGGRSTAGIGATLRPDGVIDGTVTGPAPGHAPLAGICVRATRVAGVLPPLLTVTAADGGYRLADLRPGRYLIEFFADCGTKGYRTQWWDAAHSPGAATPVTVAAGATKTGIDAALSR
jgi:hypothetical protein